MRSVYIYTEVAYSPANIKSSLSVDRELLCYRLLYSFML